MRSVYGSPESRGHQAAQGRIETAPPALPRARRQRKRFRDGKPKKPFKRKRSKSRKKKKSSAEPADSER
ncbi:MAG: hypothetical protein Ct9H300mP1_30610 [Planctomycetaceae bacterium]|nr:MAG: hypothetical protein Ct9H300mP1_30610 [Planctomycetaceae bacterium]